MNICWYYIKVSITYYRNEELNSFFIKLNDFFKFYSVENSLIIKKTINKRKKNTITLLRSPHVYKKTREQFKCIEYIQTLFIKSKKKKLILFFYFLLQKILMNINCSFNISYQVK